MININLNIRNPFNRNFKRLWGCARSTPFAHKFVEFHLYKDNSIISININWTVRQDHSGLNVEIGLLSYCFDFNFYDSRHWDTNKGHYQ